MSLYVDASALLTLYLREAQSGACAEILRSDPDWATARHTTVEVRRNLHRGLAGRDLATARDRFARDWQRTTVLELDETTCEMAAEIAEVTGARTLDSLHLAAARRVGDAGLSFLTYDLRQAQAARSLGFNVLGA